MTIQAMYVTCKNKALGCTKSYCPTAIFIYKCVTKTVSLFPFLESERVGLGDAGTSSEHPRNGHKHFIRPPHIPWDAPSLSSSMNALRVLVSLDNIFLSSGSGVPYMSVCLNKGTQWIHTRLIHGLLICLRISGMWVFCFVSYASFCFIY